MHRTVRLVSETDCLLWRSLRAHLVTDHTGLTIECHCQRGPRTFLSRCLLSTASLSIVLTSDTNGRSGDSKIELSSEFALFEWYYVSARVITSSPDNESRGMSAVYLWTPSHSHYVYCLCLNEMIPLAPFNFHDINAWSTSQTALYSLPVERKKASLLLTQYTRFWVVYIWLIDVLRPFIGSSRSF
jgi:hypothetical protein